MQEGGRLCGFCPFLPPPPRGGTHCDSLRDGMGHGSPRSPPLPPSRRWVSLSPRPEEETEAQGVLWPEARQVGPGVVGPYRAAAAWFPGPPSRPPPLPVRSEASFGVPTERKDAELAPGVTGVHRTWGGLWRAGTLCRTGWTGPGALPVPSLCDPSRSCPCLGSDPRR